MNLRKAHATYIPLSMFGGTNYNLVRPIYTQANMVITYLCVCVIIEIDIVQSVSEDGVVQVRLFYVSFDKL